MRTSPEEAAILAILQARRDPIRGSEIAFLTGFPLRLVGKAVKRLVEEEELPILSTSAVPPGYYLAQHPDDVRACAQGLRRRGISCLVRASRLHALAARMEENQPSQMEMFAAGAGARAAS